MCNKFLVTLLSIFIISHASVFADEMVLIQTVATDRKTFVIRKGHKQGIGVGQESLFSTKKVSLAARAVEVNREFSLWKILDENISVPFSKDQIVNYMTSVESIEVQIPEVRARRKEFFFDPKRYWYFRSGISRTINQNLSNAETGTDKVRQGMQFEAILSFNWRPSWEIGVGGRFDVEQEVLEQGDFAVPSSRFFLMTELIYQLDYFKGKKSNFYISAALGIGRSQTQVNDKISSGTAFVVPAVRLGWQRKYFNSWWLTFEGMMESVSTEESFKNTAPQETNFTNAKVLVGLKI